MHDLGDMLVQSGFADPVMDQETLTLTWAARRRCSPNCEHRRQRIARALRRAAHAALARSPARRAGQRLPGRDGRLRLSFEIVYGHAFKAAPRVPATGQTTVALEDMRAMVRVAARLAAEDAARREHSRTLVLS